VKRDNDYHVHIKLQTTDLLFSHQTKVFNDVSSIHLKLQSSYPNIVAPNYKLFIRDEDKNQALFNSSVTVNDCHFTGNITGLEDSKAAISICDNNLVRVLRAKRILVLNQNQNSK